MRGWAPEEKSSHKPQLVPAHLYETDSGWWRSEAMLYEVSNVVTLNVVYSRDKLVLRLMQRFLWDDPGNASLVQYSHCCGSLLTSGPGARPNEFCSTCRGREVYMQAGARRSVLIRATGAFDEVAVWCEPHAANLLEATLWAHEIYAMAKDLEAVIVSQYSIEAGVE